jgi:hypothetical protein
MKKTYSTPIVTASNVSRETTFPNVAKTSPREAVLSSLTIAAFGL